MQSDVDLIKDLVDLAVGIDRYSYPMMKNAPRPPVDDYAGVKFVSNHKQSTDEYTYSNNVNQHDIDMNTLGMRVVIFDILFCRDDVQAESLQNCLYRPDIQEFMWKNKMGIMSITKLDNDSLTLETNWEVRTGFRLEINLLRSTMTTITTIEEVQISGTYEEGDYKVDVIVDVTKG